MKKNVSHTPRAPLARGYFYDLFAPGQLELKCAVPPGRGARFSCRRVFGGEVIPGRSLLNGGRLRPLSFKDVPSTQILATPKFPLGVH